MKLTFSKWFLFVPVLVATACSTADRQPMISPSPANGDRSSDNSTGVQQSSNHFYSFVRSNPTDPDNMKSFGVDQTTKVLNAIQNVKGGKFSLDTELDPLKIRVSNIKEKLAGYTANLKPTDTFVMYSHSHGVVPLGISCRSDQQDFGQVARTTQKQRKKFDHPDCGLLRAIVQAHRPGHQC
ncbi:hypothetical protein EBR21_08585 [bacterium]|nr:hypothetical protein [bacterium]